MVLTLTFSGQAFSQSQTYDALLRLAQLRKTGQFESAIRLAESVLQSGTDYRVMVEKGESELQLGLNDAAVNSFTKASELRRNAGSFGLARAHAARGDAALSVTFLDSNLSSEFRVSDRLCHTDRFLKLIEMKPEWKEYWKEVRHSRAEIVADETEYLIALGKPAEALEFLGSVQDVSVESSEYIYSMALASFHAGDPASAISVLTRGTMNKFQQLKRNKLLAECYIETGDYSKALNLLSSLIDSEIAEPELFRARAQAYLGMKDNIRALTDLDYYLSISSNDTKALKAASVAAAGAGDNSLSLRYMNQVLVLEPGNRETYIKRGDMWSASGMWRDAVSDYSMALDLDPVDGDLYLKKAEALLRLGNTEQACSDLRMSVRYGNRNASGLYNRNCIR